MTTKKKTSKKTAATKETIIGKSVGRNVIVVIDGKKYSKAFKEKADRTDILALVDAYNTRNSKKKLEKIIDTLSKNKKTLEEKTVEAKAKTTKVKVAKKPKVDKVPTKAELKAAEDLLKKHDYGKYAKSEQTVAAPAPRRGREW